MLPGSYQCTEGPLAHLPVPVYDGSSASCRKPVVVRPLQTARQFIDEILPVPIVHGYGSRMAADAFDAGAGFTVTLGLKVGRECTWPAC